MENKSRTITKIVLWQTIAIGVTIAILQFVMNNLTKAITVGLIDHSVCLFIHYFYERGWSKIKWGIVDKEKERENENENENNI